MTIDFGSIQKYSDRGYGFVAQTFVKAESQVFFHITTIKKKYSELAKNLNNGEPFEEVSFWYQFETSKRGKQVTNIWLRAKDIPQRYQQELSDLIQQVEAIWKNLESSQPSWLDFITIELLGSERRDELNVERDNLENQLRAAEEERRREAQALRQNEITRISHSHGLTKVEADELERLLAEMRPLNFTRSKQLSQYIVRRKIGYKYPNISGIVRMEDQGEEWNFHGGFPTNIYKIICKELGLDNERTTARAIDFTSFENALRR